MRLSVAAVIATYKRPDVLRRLLHSLAKTGDELTAIVVVDNAGSEDTRLVVEEAGAVAHYVNPGSNLGCGGGLSLGEQRALEIGGENLTHILILDDDAVIPPDAIRVLGEAMEKEQADVACPLVVDGENMVGWLPLMASFGRQMRKRSRCTPDEFRERFGTTSRPFYVALGICLMVTRRAITKWGTHRSDYWVRGEDIEFSRRLTEYGKGIFVPTVVAQHLPPPQTGVSESREIEYLKHLALVQNMALICFRLRHGRCLAWTMPGTLLQFFKIWSWRGIPDSIRAVWRGVVLGHPAGAGSGRTFHAQFTALTSPS